MKDSVLQRIAAGDPSAVRDCLDNYGGLVWSLAMKWLNHVADAEDITQEIFVDLWQNAVRFDPRTASETVFVTMIARRRLIDRLRRNRTGLNTVSFDPATIDLADGTLEHPSDLADEAKKAAKCLDRLTEEQRKVLVMSIHHGASHNRISETLGMPLGTVKSYARRGLIQLRDCMKRSSVPQATESHV